jgi:MFS family permease
MDSLKWTGRALRSRNYRLFFAGQGISLIGTWMQRIAMSWLVYRLTNSPLLLGSVDFAGQLAAVAVAPLAGLVADHIDRRRLIVVTQTFAMLQAGVLAALVLTGHIQVWQLFALSMFMGMINGCDMPARQAFVVEMIDERADLPNAIALNSTIFNGARLIGPAIAGVLVARIGEGYCFLLNAVSYLAVIAALLAMRVSPRERPPAPTSLLHGLREGFRYAFGSVPIRNALLLIALTNLAGTPYMTLMPIFAKQILHGDSQTLGFLMSCAGVGAIVGALYLASRKQTHGLPKVMALAGLSFSVGIILFSQSRWLPLSMGLMLLTGFGMMAQMASANTLLQTLVDDDKRGRVMSIHLMSFMGTSPFGSLWGGAVANHLGAPVAVLIGGLLCLLAALAFATQVRRMQSHAH